MIDAQLVPLQRLALTPLARVLACRGVSADTLTLAGFGIGVLAIPALALGQWALAAASILANRLFAGLDGTVARIKGPTERGAFLDVALDFVFYALVPLGFALHDPVQNGLPAAVLIASFVGTGSSFLAFAAVASRLGKSSTAFPAKGIYYLGGLTEGFETIVLFGLMCLFPASFPVLALIFAAACGVTTVLRWHHGWRMFGKDLRGM